jgi:hypothetical protein
MFGLAIKSLMTGAGFEGGAYSSSWIMSWIGLAVIILLIILSKKWLAEEQIAGPYSFIGGFLGALVYFIVVSLTGQAKWSILAGLIGMAIGGFGAPRVGLDNA